jgi:hypothetical protein
VDALLRFLIGVEIETVATRGYFASALVSIKKDTHVLKVKI